MFEIYKYNSRIKVGVEYKNDLFKKKLSDGSVQLTSPKKLRPNFVLKNLRFALPENASKAFDYICESNKLCMLRILD